jgi:HSP20 family protein
MNSRDPLQNRLNALSGGDELLETLTSTWSTDWIPPVNIVNSTEEIRILSELPGVEAKDVDVLLQENVLTIKGVRYPQKGARLVPAESRLYGVFMRSFNLPSWADAASVKADFTRSLLTVLIPRKGVRAAASVARFRI